MYLGEGIEAGSLARDVERLPPLKQTHSTPVIVVSVILQITPFYANDSLFSKLNFTIFFLFGARLLSESNGTGTGVQVLPVLC